MGFGNRNITRKPGLICANAEVAATKTKGAPQGAPFASLDGDTGGANAAKNHSE
jgi:hypothetical protein